MLPAAAPPGASEADRYAEVHCAERNDPLGEAELEAVDAAVGVALGPVALGLGELDAVVGNGLGAPDVDPLDAAPVAPVVQPASSRVTAAADPPSASRVRLCER